MPGCQSVDNLRQEAIVEIASFPGARKTEMDPWLRTPKLRTVPVDLLRRGMYVHELNAGWLRIRSGAAAS